MTLLTILAHAVWPWLHKAILVRHINGTQTKHCVGCGRKWRW